MYVTVLVMIYEYLVTRLVKLLIMKGWYIESVYHPLLCLLLFDSFVAFV